MPSLSFILKQTPQQAHDVHYFERMRRCDYDGIIALTWLLLMQRTTEVVETPWHHKIRRSYAIGTQYILHDTQLIKIIRHSITSDMLWIRNVRHRYAVTTLHMPQVRDRYTYWVAVVYLAIKLRPCYVSVALLSFLRCKCDTLMVNRRCYERVAIFFKHV